MHNMKKYVILIVLALLVVAYEGYGIYEAQKPAIAPVVVYKAPEVPKVADIIKATNDYRATKGLAPLAENAKLDESACLKAQDMMTKDYWAHVSPDGTQPWSWFKRVGYDYRYAGENLAYGFNSGKVVMNGWINSPEHEVNLVGDYTETGVCVKTGQYQGGNNNLVVAHYGKLR